MPMTDGIRADHRPSRNRVGMQEVAARAGVALSSVSRVLSRHPDVSDVMRNKVIDAVAALGYEPNLLAQSLRRGASMTVGFVVGNISNPLLSEIGLGAELELRSAGYSMLLANSMDDATLDNAHIRLFAQRRVDGLLLSLASETSQATIEALSRIDLPVVMVDREACPTPMTSSVLTDHAGGISAAVEHLVELGHRRIALVNGRSDLRPARERASALRRVCRRYPHVTGVVRSGAFTSAHGAAATAAMLDNAAPPTAIIAGNNQILVGVLRVLRERNVSIPADVSLITCDESPLSEFVEPPLATIHRDPQLMGSTAAELLLELFAGGSVRTAVLPASFRAADSCAPPRDGRQ